MSDAKKDADDEGQTPWDDPNVKDALKGGRDATDIFLIDCPGCGLAGYYNNGSHFTCRACGAGYACITDDEEAPVDRPFIVLGEEYTLEDYIDAEVYSEDEPP